MAQKCLFKFQTESDYNTAKENGLITPNISMIVETGNTYINADTAVTAYYNVQDITAPTMICGATSGFKSIEVDGVVLPSVVEEYQFDTVGEHTIKYEFNDPTAIGDSAFSDCSGLTKVKIPDSVTSIGESAFGGCSGLTNITIPNNVTSIGQYAFSGCSGLTSATIGNSVTNIGIYVFSDCSGLANIVVDSGNTVYDSRDNCNAIIETSTNTLIQGCKNTVIPNGVTSIGQYAFATCSGLTSITIPNSVTSIGESAFGGCSSLTSITIPNSVTSIGGSAFQNCSGLTSITIPDSVTSIGDGAFADCSGLTNITSLAITAPTITNYTFLRVKTGGTLTVPSGSTGYDVWMGTGDYYLGKYNWTKNEQ